MKLYELKNLIDNLIAKDSEYILAEVIVENFDKKFGFVVDSATAPNWEDVGRPFILLKTMSPITKYE